MFLTHMYLFIGHGHVQRKDYRCIGQRILNMELPGRRKRGGAQKIHGFNELGHAEGSCEEKDVRERVRWKQIIYFCDP